METGVLPTRTGGTERPLCLGAPWGPIQIHFHSLLMNTWKSKGSGWVFCSVLFLAARRAHVAPQSGTETVPPCIGRAGHWTMAKPQKRKFQNATQEEANSKYLDYNVAEED